MKGNAVELFSFYGSSFAAVPYSSIVIGGMPASTIVTTISLRLFLHIQIKKPKKMLMKTWRQFLGTCMYLIGTMKFWKVICYFNGSMTVTFRQPIQIVLKVQLFLEIAKALSKKLTLR